MKSRWLIASLIVAGILIAGAVRFYKSGEIVSAILYCGVAVLFLLVAYGYFKGVLK